MRETLGAAWTAGKSRRFPDAVDCVTARFTKRAFAVDGMTQLGDMAKTQVTWPWRTGPPIHGTFLVTSAERTRVLQATLRAPRVLPGDASARDSCESPATQPCPHWK